eukprot:CAMPEP_0114570336 /NCGR_PEP_ID=MMETSP0114-20121206/17140_1 /TAXON_ID=31324 /ORGANISM="Goniomonas sp, Strain m" /LENGTH=41 /DNA_ID= /DNA_START= /DNA_END= /DNA_ORIENTATION=
MKHLAAYMLCTLGGKENPTEADIKKVFNSIGAQVDAQKLSA